MKIYEYENYQEYIEVQTAANKQKINLVWVNIKTIERIANLINAKNILCHGTRNGAELTMFRKQFPKATIIGTEISDTADQFPNTVLHDFHEIKTEWLNKFDIVYSNSWDHSYDPDKSLAVWKNQLNDNGILCIDHGYDPIVNRSRKKDPLEIYHDEILDHFEQHGLSIVEIFESIGGGNKSARIYITRKENCKDNV